MVRPVQKKIRIVKPGKQIRMKIGFVLGLFGFATLDIGPKLALIGFELGLFFGEIVVFKRKMGKIGFVLHKKYDLSNILYWCRVYQTRFSCLVTRVPCLIKPPSLFDLPPWPRPVHSSLLQQRNK